jgi:hypothetical protein
LILGGFAYTPSKTVLFKDEEEPEEPQMEIKNEIKSEVKQEEYEVVRRNEK